MKSGFVFAALVLLCSVAPAVRADAYDDVSKLLRNGELLQAETQVDLHLQAKPRDPQMRYFKGLIQRDSGRAEDALETFKRLSEDYPELPEPYNALGVIYAAQGQYGQAQLALQAALRANPGYVTAHENLGDLYSRMAQQSYCQALQYAPQNPELKAKLTQERISCP